MLDYYFLVKEAKDYLRFKKTNESYSTKSVFEYFLSLDIRCEALQKTRAIAAFFLAALTKTRL